MSERERLNIVFKNHRDYTSEEIQLQARKAEEEKAKFSEMSKPVTGRIELAIPTSEPIRLLPISDTHLYAPETDNSKVDAIFDELNEKNTYGVICGDFIEGIHTNIPDHSGKIIFTFDEQLWLAKERIKPFVRNGKIIALVGWYNGHEGWLDRAAMAAIRFLKDGLYQPDGSELQAVFNGGLLRLDLSNGDKFLLRTFHDAGGGGSDDINPVGSQRKAAWAEKLNSPNRVDGVVAGHQHHRAGSAKEITYNKLSGGEIGQILLALGTTKGNDDEHADKYLVSQAKGPTLPPGGSIVLNQNRRDSEENNNVWTSYGYDKGGILYEAAKIWDKTEKQGITEEVVGKIIKREGKPTAEFDRRNSRTRSTDDDSRTPLFETFRWRIKDGNLPILVYLLANTRYGSESGESGRKKYNEIIDQVSGDPFKYVLAMRNFVDDGVAKDFYREGVLDDIASGLSHARETNSLLGFMLDKNLRAERWTKDVFEINWDYDRHKGKWVSERDVREGIYPGDYLYKHSKIAKTPLYLNDSLMLLNLNGKTEYAFQLLDHLSWSGSEFDMFRGLVQSQRKGRLAIDVVAGGHMPGAGVMTTPEGIFVATGWFSDYNSRGKSNIKKAPLGGQGVILFPNTKMAIPAATRQEATDMHASLILNEGLNHNEKKKLMAKKSR